MTEWYFAYGSNLWTDQMAARTGPVAEGEDRPRRAFLPDHRLTFDVPGENGQVFANIHSPGAGVHGVLYCCTSDTLKRLDEFEHGYERQRVTVVLENGDRQEAFAYFAGPTGLVQGRLPTAEYLRRILTGAREHGLPDWYVREIEACASASG
ncbi:gamma-glutamylcyclotransferase family protein [Zavarzinella formosa]|uniref:gamma-glutamylcyclotransferase family protein n=1 Tax=Zavarzinella formosa TaxID=360055 RepID=UPI00030B4777|nr:gamma-glutamylcyclotransferase family protein [Zavarzinella formosa]